MCGIAGFIKKNEIVSFEEIKLMTDALKHRGPDDEGFYFGNNFALGHRRLSIIDLSKAGRQPMIYNGYKGEYTIVFNGEIYNYIEIKSELKDLGYYFNTNTDTEVILAAYDQWGNQCLNKFNGMWAFVIYDKKRQILFGARDRFGVKPFYYLYKNDYFAFASEIKALLKLPYHQFNINERAIFKYLAFGEEEQDEENFFQGVQELLPSEFFILNLDNLDFKKAKYYKLSFNDRYEKYDNKKSTEYIEKTKTLIFNAIEKRLRSDVPVGSCLSGGLDSSTVVCVINKLLKEKEIKSIGEKQKAFTASYSNSYIDESKWAKLVVEQTGAEWFQTFPKDNELIQDLEDLVYYQEIPFGSTSIYAQYRVMKLARQNGVKVILDGQGGDELFTGYSMYYPTFYYELVRNDLKRLLIEIKNYRNSPILYYQFFWFFGAKIIYDKIPVFFLREFLPYLKANFKILNKDFLHNYTEEICKRVENLPNSLNQHLYKFITGKNLKTLLKYEDRNSMRFSIEARTPFADDINLIEFVFQVPSTYKIFRGWSKYLLRESMKGILCEPIRNRIDKIGFATPEKEWMLANKKWIETLINDHRDLIDRYIDFKILNESLKNDKIFNKGFLLWRIVNLILWMKRFRIVKN